MLNENYLHLVWKNTLKDEKISNNNNENKSCNNQENNNHN